METSSRHSLTRQSPVGRHSRQTSELCTSLVGLRVGQNYKVNVQCACCSTVLHLSLGRGSHAAARDGKARQAPMERCGAALRALEIPRLRCAPLGMTKLWCAGKGAGLSGHARCWISRIPLLASPARRFRLGGRNDGCSEAGMKDVWTLSDEGLGLGEPMGEVHERPHGHARGALGDIALLAGRPRGACDVEVDP